MPNTGGVLLTFDDIARRLTNQKLIHVPKCIMQSGRGHYMDIAGVTLTTGAAGDEARRLVAVSGTANLFTTLGVQAAIGRTFLPDEEQLGARCVVMLSHGLWLEAFGGDPEAVGRTARLGGAPCQVIGVMPTGFVFPDSEIRLFSILLKEVPLRSYVRRFLE